MKKTRTCERDIVSRFARTTDRAELEKMLREVPGIATMSSVDERLPAIIIASEKHNPEAVRLLLEHGADPNFADSNGMGPLHYTVSGIGGERECTSCAYDYHWDCVTAPSSDYARIIPKHMGLRVFNKRRVELGKAEDVVQLLIGAGADKEATDWKGRTPLLLAAEMGDVPVGTALLAAGADARASGNALQTALHLYSLLGISEMVEPLVGAGADVNARDRAGRTPLFFATAAGSAPTVEALLKAGADRHAEDAGGRRLLHSASFMGKAAVIRLLIGDNGEANQIDGAGNLPLNLAVSQARRDAIEALLEAGADSDHLDGHGLTAFHYAAWSGVEDIVDRINDTLDIHDWIMSSDRLTPPDVAAMRRRFISNRAGADVIGRCRRSAPGTDWEADDLDDIS